MSVSNSYTELQKRSENFLKITGRRPRILLTGANSQTSSKSLKAVAVVFADAGFDVDISPASADSVSIAKMACENDVHAVGISGWQGERDDLAKDITEALAGMGGDIIKVSVQSVETDSRLENPHPDRERLAVQYAEKTLDLIGA